jgi:hypothetical protein
MHRSLSYTTSGRDGTGEGNLFGRRNPDAGEITVRRARPSDAQALAALAAIDSARPLTGERVVGEVDGRIVAAVSLYDGRAVADPFEPTADVVEILRLHTAGARSAAARPRLRRPRVTLPRLAPRLV